MSSKIVSYLICGFVIFLPLVVVPNIFNPYELGKFIYFVATVQITLILSILFFRKKINIPFDKLSVFIYLFLFVVFISDVLGLDFKTSMLGSEWRLQGFLTLFSGVILFILLRNFPPSKEFFEKSLFLTAFLICLIAIYQGGIFIFFHGQVATYQGRIVGTMGNPNFLAGILVMILPFILQSHFKRKMMGVFLKLILIILIFVSIFLSESRSGEIGAVFVFLTSVFYQVKTQFPSVSDFFKSRKVKYMFIGFLMILAFIIVQTLISQRISVWDNRGLIWVEGLKAIFSRPVLGYGQENFELIYPVSRHIKIDNAHNLFIETAVSSGFLGLFLLIMVLLYGIKAASFPVKLSLSAFILSGFFNPLSIAQIAFFWFLLGITREKV